MINRSLFLAPALVFSAITASGCSSDVQDQLDETQSLQELNEKTDARNAVFDEVLPSYIDLFVDNAAQYGYTERDQVIISQLASLMRDADPVKEMLDNPEVVVSAFGLDKIPEQNRAEEIDYIKTLIRDVYPQITEAASMEASFKTGDLNLDELSERRGDSAELKLSHRGMATNVLDKSGLSYTHGDAFEAVVVIAGRAKTHGDRFLRPYLNSSFDQALATLESTKAAGPAVLSSEL